MSTGFSAAEKPARSRKLLRLGSGGAKRDASEAAPPNGSANSLEEQPSLPANREGTASPLGCRIVETGALIPQHEVEAALASLEESLFPLGRSPLDVGLLPLPQGEGTRSSSHSADTSLAAQVPNLETTKLDELPSFSDLTERFLVVRYGVPAGLPASAAGLERCVREGFPGRPPPYISPASQISSPSADPAAYELPLPEGATVLSPSRWSDRVEGTPSPADQIFPEQPLLHPATGTRHWKGAEDFRGNGQPQLLPVSLPTLSEEGTITGPAVAADQLRRQVGPSPARGMGTESWRPRPRAGRAGGLTQSRGEADGDVVVIDNDGDELVVEPTAKRAKPGRRNTEPRKSSGQLSLSEMGWVRPSQKPPGAQPAEADTPRPPTHRQIQRCPICNKEFPVGTMNSDVNRHIDECLNQLALEAGDDL